MSERLSKYIDSIDYCDKSEIVNKFSLTLDKIIPEMHLKHRGFTYSACGSLTEKK